MCLKLDKIKMLKLIIEVFNNFLKSYYDITCVNKKIKGFLLKTYVLASVKNKNFY